MIYSNVQCAYGPGVGEADAADFLCDKLSKLARQDTFAVFGTSDKGIG